MQNEAAALLRCPICSGSFHQEGKSLLCDKRHCYDVAKQGHVNFAPNAKPSFYKKELFESRAKAFEAGVFAPVVAAVGEALEKYVRAERPAETRLYQPTYFCTCASELSFPHQCSLHRTGDIRP